MEGGTSQFPPLDAVSWKSAVPQEQAFNGAHLEQQWEAGGMKAVLHEIPST